VPDDPLYGLYLHPAFPAGYNADDIAGDEVDGAGTNWAIWPEYFVSYEGLEPLLLLVEDIEAFADLCADYVVPCADDTLTVSHEIDVLRIRRRA
jgi:hypothetical protein